MFAGKGTGGITKVLHSTSVQLSPNYTPICCTATILVRKTLARKAHLQTVKGRLVQIVTRVLARACVSKRAVVKLHGYCTLCTELTATYMFTGYCACCSAT
jgi:hypothetical protein